MCSVGKRMVDVPSFMVRLDSEKHIEYSLTSPYGAGRAGRVKRKSLRNKKAKAAEGGDDDGDKKDTKGDDGTRPPACPLPFFLPAALCSPLSCLSLPDM